VLSSLSSLLSAPSRPDDARSVTSSRTTCTRTTDWLLRRRRRRSLPRRRGATVAAHDGPLASRDRTDAGRSRWRCDRRGRGPPMMKRTSSPVTRRLTPDVAAVAAARWASSTSASPPPRSAGLFGLLWANQKHLIRKTSAALQQSVVSSGGSAGSALNLTTISSPNRPRRSSAPRFGRTARSRRFPESLRTVHRRGPKQAHSTSRGTIRRAGLSSV